MFPAEPSAAHCAPEVLHAHIHPDQLILTCSETARDSTSIQSVTVITSATPFSPFGSPGSWWLSRSHRSPTVHRRSLVRLCFSMPTPIFLPALLDFPRRARAVSSPTRSLSSSSDPHLSYSWPGLPWRVIDWLMLFRRGKGHRSRSSKVDRPYYSRLLVAHASV